MGPYILGKRQPEIQRAQKHGDIVIEVKGMLPRLTGEPVDIMEEKKFLYIPVAVDIVHRYIPGQAHDQKKDNPNRIKKFSYRIKNTFLIGKKEEDNTAGYEHPYRSFREKGKG
jgi:hypothetical protein